MTTGAPAFARQFEDRSSLKIIPKTDSPIMCRLGQVFPTFFSRTITTIGQTIFLPSEWHLHPAAEQHLLLAHEIAHMRQQHRISVPLFLFVNWFVLPQFFCPFRLQWEKDAWVETIDVAIRDFGIQFVSSIHFQEFVVRYLATSAGGWTWPNVDAARRWTIRTIARRLQRAERKGL